MWCSSRASTRRTAEQYGSQRLAVQIVAVSRSTGVEGLPASDDWTTWNAGEMQAAVDYLRCKRGLPALSFSSSRTASSSEMSVGQP